MNIMQVSIMRCCNHFDDRKDQVKFMRKRNYSSIAKVLAVILCVTTILTFSFYGSDAKAVTLGRPVLVSAQKILADDAGKTVPMTDGEFTFKLSFDRCITGSQGNWKSFYDARNDSAGNIQFNLGYKADIPYNEIAVYKMEEVAGSETSRIEYSSQVYYVAIGYDDNGVAIQYYNKINENGPYDQVDASEVKFTNTVKTQPVPVTRYVVTFNSEGGSAVASQTVAAGSTAVKPADPTKAGYKFADWYTAAEGGTAYDFNTKVMSNITLYAHWDKAASADKPFIMLMAKMSTLGYDLGHTETPVIPVMVGDEPLAREMSEMLYNEGIFAQAIVYPTVAKGKARLRVMISAAHTKEDLDKAVAAFEKVGRKAGAI